MAAAAACRGCSRAARLAAKRLSWAGQSGHCLCRRQKLPGAAPPHLCEHEYSPPAVGDRPAQLVARRVEEEQAPEGARQVGQRPPARQRWQRRPAHNGLRMRAARAAPGPPAAQCAGRARSREVAVCNVEVEEFGVVGKTHWEGRLQGGECRGGAAHAVRLARLAAGAGQHAGQHARTVLPPRTAPGGAPGAAPRLQFGVSKRVQEP